MNCLGLRRFGLHASMLCLAMGGTSAMAASQSEINTAIDNGLAYLATSQTAGGYWNFGGYEPAATGRSGFRYVESKESLGY